MNKFIAENKPMYSSMYDKTMMGKTYSISDMTPAVVEKLWADEMVADAEIAMLFNTSAGMVRAYRHAHGITRAARMKAGADALQGILGNLGSYIMQVNVA